MIRPFGIFFARERAERLNFSGIGNARSALAAKPRVPLGAVVSRDAVKSSLRWDLRGKRRSVRVHEMVHGRTPGRRFEQSFPYTHLWMCWPPAKALLPPPAFAARDERAYASPITARPRRRADLDAMVELRLDRA